MNATMTIPRVMIAGLGGDTGKTLVSLGLIAALRLFHHKRTAAFKKGPDYIDAAWLSVAAGQWARNLDTFLMEGPSIVRAVDEQRGSSDVAIIEGNRGLYDGFDARGTHSSAQLAKLLACPVILVIDVTKVTRTVSALVRGCQVLDPAVSIAGVIINRYATDRQRDLITEAIEQDCDVPVVGALSRLNDRSLLPERHLGLITPIEHKNMTATVEKLAMTVERCVDCERILEIMSQACRSPFPFPITPIDEGARPSDKQPCTIGYFSDSAFSFYYPENLEALERGGATLLPFSSLTTATLPDVDGLYIGGGFPETHAEALAANCSLMVSIRERVLRGLPVYAECGGLIYLSSTLCYRDHVFPMAGVFPVAVEMRDRPAGHGYALVRVTKANPYFPDDMCLRGHEFHYSTVVDLADTPTVFQMERGTGAHAGRDGLLAGNAFATYVHLHARGCPQWAPAFCRQAAVFRSASR